MKKDKTFEESVARLEEIVKALDTGDLALDEALGLFEEGVKLAGDCSKQLSDAQGKLDIAATYEVLQGDKSVEKFPEQTITSGLVSQSLPISKLAPGAYTLGITLTDRASHKDLHETVPLLIE